MPFEDFRAWGLRVNQEFHDQFMSEKEDPHLADNPPFPFLEWRSYKEYVGSQINFVKTFCQPIIK
jgi:hypothetical protein